MYNYSDDFIKRRYCYPRQNYAVFFLCIEPINGFSYGYFQFYSMELGAGSPFINTYGYVTPTMPNSLLNSGAFHMGDDAHGSRGAHVLCLLQEIKVTPEVDLGVLRLAVVAN